MEPAEDIEEIIRVRAIMATLTAAHDAIRDPATAQVGYTAIRTQEDALVTSTRSTLATRLSSAGMQTFDVYVTGVFKASIKIFTEASSTGGGN